MSWIIRSLVLIIAMSAWADSHARGRLGGGKHDSITISGVVLSNGTAFVTPATSGTTIDTVSATCSMGSCTGATFALATTGSCSGASSNGSFAISGSNLNIGGSTVNAGSYPIGIAVTLVGASNSGMCFPFTLVGSSSGPVAAEEFVGPFASWTCVQSSAGNCGAANHTVCAAAGDGTTNDISAIQACINTLSPTAPVIWFPAATYKIADIAATASQGSPGTTMTISGATGTVVTGMSIYGCTNLPLGDYVANISGSTVTLGTGSTSNISGTCHFSLELRARNNTNDHYFSLIGADPTTTKWSWAGSAGGVMLRIDGTDFNKINRLTFDANGPGAAGAAGIIIDQSGYASPKNFADVGNEFADDYFLNWSSIAYQCGVQAPGVNQCSESNFIRDRFTNSVSGAGISTGNHNADDIWVWWSQFTNVGHSVTNAFHGGDAGNFSVFNSNFSSSGGSDIETGNTDGAYNFVNNYSSGAYQFFNASLDGYQPIVLKGNALVNSVVAVTVHLFGPGPLLSVGNTVVTRSGATAFGLGSGYNATDTTGPYIAVGQNGAGRGDVLSVDNVFFPPGGTFPTPCTIGSTLSWGGGRCHEFSDTISSVTPPAPTLPALPANLGRTIFEASASSGTNNNTCSTSVPCTVQAAVCKAATGVNTFSSGACSGTVTASRNVVHLSPGTYSECVVVPASDIQIIGDGYSVNVQCGGSATPTIKLTGPSKVTMRDFRVSGSVSNTVDAIEINTADQVGAVVWADQLLMANNETNHLFVDTMSHVLVEVHDSHFLDSTNAGVKTNSSAQTNIFACVSITDVLGYSVSGAANLFVQGCWNDGGVGPLGTIAGSGNFTLAGSHTGLNQGQTAMTLSSYTGTALIGPGDFTPNDFCVSTPTPCAPMAIGTSTGANVLGVGTATPSLSYWNPSGVGQTQYINGFQYTGGYAAIAESCANPSSPCPGSTATLAALNQLATQNPTYPSYGTVGVTAVQLHHLELSAGRYGLHVIP